MKRLLCYLSVALLAFGCVEPVDDTPTTGDIVGSVSDQSTGEPVATVTTSLTPGGKKSVTGSDGTFEYKDLDPGLYTIAIDKEGYNTSMGQVRVKAGEQAPLHLLIERVPAIITPDRNELDFGDKEDVNTMSFSIVNSGYVDLEWSIEHNCKWIQEIKPAQGTLAYGKTESIIVVIDREKLNIGANESLVVIRSTNGRAELTVKATGVERTVLVPDCASLDFGKDEGVNKLSFSLHNSGREDLDWNVEYDCNWIKEINPQEGTLKVGKKVTVTVGIDRELLKSGNNKTVIVISSTNGHADLEVLAEGIVKESPTLNILDVSDITSKSAVFKAEILNEGTPKYTERGFVYSTSSYPTIETTIEKLTSPVTEDKTFSVNASKLELSTKYYVRAYAKSSLGVAYSGNEVSFEPVQILPAVTTDNPSNISIGSGRATLNGNVTFIGDPAYTEHGFVYGQVHNPTVDDDTKKVVSGKSEGVYSANVSDLAINTIYYVRAFATNDLGTAYGEEKVVDMSQIMPVVTTKEVTDITGSSATFYASLDSVGDPALSERGFIYGTMPVPTLELTDIIKLTVAGSALGDYTSHATGLTENTTYYVRAYAIAANNITYGEIVSFKNQNPNYIVLADAGIMVQRADIGQGYWSPVKSMCENSITSGYTDWRLPTLNELMVLYNDKENIGGFTDYNYWTSEDFYSNSVRCYRYINFKNGNASYVSDSRQSEMHGRCVRSINSGSESNPTE